MNWKICKNTLTAKPCHQLYYDLPDGRRRYLDRALSYSAARALLDALEDVHIRQYATEHMQTPILEAYAHRKANWDVWCAMNALNKRYCLETGTIDEDLICAAIRAEENP